MFPLAGKKGNTWLFYITHEELFKTQHKTFFIIEA